MDSNVRTNARRKALVALASLAVICLMVSLGAAPALAELDVIPPDSVLDCSQALAPYPDLECVSDDAGRFALWKAAGWTMLDTGQQQDTVLVIVPDSTDWHNNFTIDVAERGRALSALDLPGVIADFDRVLRSVPGTYVLWQNRWQRGSVLGFDARYSISELGEETMRWMRILYAGTRRYVLVAESDGEWEAHYPMFMAMMLTFQPR